MTYLICSYYVQDGNLYHNDEFASNFVPEIRNAFVSPLTGEDLIEIGFMISGDTEDHKFTTPISKLDSVQFEEIDSRCICFNEKGNSTRKTVLNYIQLLWADKDPDLPAGVYLDRLGWNSDHTFAAGPQVLGVRPKGPCQFSPEIRELIPISSLPEDPGPVVERVLLGDWENTSVYLPLLAYAAMSPLRAVFVKNGLPACAVLNLQGPYGRGKTHAARTFFNHYNRSNGEPAFFLETNSTESAVLNVLHYASGQTVVLDDIAKGSSKTIGSKRLQLVAKVLRMAQNNAPREKMDGKSGVSEKCEACVVLTGELSPDAESEVTRCIRIDIKDQLMGGPSREDVAAAIFRICRTRPLQTCSRTRISCGWTAPGNLHGRSTGSGA